MGERSPQTFIQKFEVIYNWFLKNNKMKPNWTLMMFKVLHKAVLSEQKNRAYADSPELLILS